MSQTVDEVFDPERLAAVRATGLLDTGPDEAFDGLAALAAKLLSAPFAFVTLVDDRRSFWKSCIGISSHDPADRQNLVDESFCQYVVRSREPLIVGDVRQNPLTADNPSIESMGVRAWAGFPVFGPSGHVLGSFCVVDLVEREWTDRDVEVLRVLSEAVAREFVLRGAISDAQLAVSERDAANAKLAVLVDVAEAMQSATDPDAALTELARLLVPLLGDWSLIALVDDQGSTRYAGWWHDDDGQRLQLEKFVEERLHGASERGVTAPLRADREPLLVRSGAVEIGLRGLRSDAVRNAYIELNPGSFGLFPIVFGARVIGVLVLMRDMGRPPLSADEVELVRVIADRAAVAFENADRLRTQESIAAQLFEANTMLQRSSAHDRIVSRALQDAMLTQLPEPDHLHLAARYLTAAEDDQVGGDWYDALLTTDGAATLVIGDVAGHDIASATIMGQLRNLLRAFAWNDPHETPSSLIARLDRAMSDLGIAAMTTLVVVRIEQTPADEPHGLRQLRWSSAGHPIPIMVAPDGTAALLDGTSDRPIGIGPLAREHVRTDHTCSVSPGSSLLLYTDGLIETRVTALDERQQELLATAARHASGTPDDLLTGVLDDMIATQPADDVAVLAVRFHPEDRPRPLEAGPADEHNHP